MPKNPNLKPNWSKENPAPRHYTPVQLKADMVSGFMEEYRRSGPAAWRILAHENPEGFLRLGAYLAPKEMQLDVFMSDVSDRELDHMIDVLREQVANGNAHPPMKLIEAGPGKIEAANAEK